MEGWEIVMVDTYGSLSEQDFGTISPNYTSLEIIEKNKAMQRNEITPEEVMSILSDPNIRAELNACIDAGF